MPENPNLNSARMLRAQRINGIEDALLCTRLSMMDRERRQSMRITSQDLRMVNLTLDYINSSSGYSAEALPPDHVESEQEKHTESPSFMYGERLRRWNSRRVESAPSIGRDRPTAAGASPAAAAGDTTAGPGQPIDADAGGSGAKREEAWGKVRFSRRLLKQWQGGDGGGDGDTSQAAGEVTATMTVAAEVTRPASSLALVACHLPGVGSNKRDTRKLTATNTSTSRPRSTRPTASPDDATTTNTTTRPTASPDDRRQCQWSRSRTETTVSGVSIVRQERKQVRAHQGKATVTQAVNKVRVSSTGCRRMRNVTPMQALVKPVSKTMRQKRAWEEKLTLNVDRNLRLESRLRLFMVHLPAGHKH